MKIPDELSDVLSHSEDIMGGAICFIGTRIPVEILLDNVSAGVSLAEIFENYPSLTPQLVEPVLRWENNQARQALGLELVA